MVVSLNKGTPYRPQNTIVLIIGAPKKVLLILGNPQFKRLALWGLCWGPLILGKYHIGVLGFSVGGPGAMESSRLWV